jgi:hypothetical protein
MLLEESWNKIQNGFGKNVLLPYLCGPLEIMGGRYFRKQKNFQQKVKIFLAGLKKFPIFAFPSEKRRKKKECSLKQMI